MENDDDYNADEKTNPGGALQHTEHDVTGCQDDIHQSLAAARSQWYSLLHRHVQRQQEKGKCT